MPDAPRATARPTFAISGIGYSLGSERRTIRELESAGLVSSDASTLERFGFQQVCIASKQSPYELAVAAAGDALSAWGGPAEDIDLLLYGGTAGARAFRGSETIGSAAMEDETVSRFRYPGTRLQHDLGLDAASVIGVNQLACTTLLGALRIAIAMLAAEHLDRALCVASEFYPSLAGRETLYNCTSDAACAILVEREGARNRIVGAHTVTKGYYWDAEARREEVVASYFPTARAAIARTLIAADWRPGDVDWVIPHNVSARSWEILLGLADLPRARIWGENIARYGHTLAGDNFINLRDAVDAGAVLPGQRVLLFAYGYGAHWTGLALEA